MNSFENMFFNKSTLNGGLATAIPGEIYGFWEAHKLAGRLSWKSLFEPSIEMCKNGFIINKALANAIKNSENKIRQNEQMREIFVNKQTNRVYSENDTIKMPQLAKTLELLSESDDLNRFYSSDFTRLMVDEINENGGNVTFEDFRNYQAIVSEPIVVDLDHEHKLLTSSIPSSGILVSFIMRLMHGKTLFLKFIILLKNNTEMLISIIQRIG